MDSLNNVIFSSNVRLQTGFMRFIGEKGTLTLTGDNQLMFTGNGSSHAKDFSLKLNEIAMADFRIADTGRVFIYTKSRLTYKLVFSKKPMQSTFSKPKDDSSAKVASKVKLASEWENHLKSMIDPRLVLVTSPRA